VTEAYPSWAHQKKAVEQARGLPGLALFFGVGLGKTKTVIDILRELMNSDKRMRRTLIFTKPLVVPQFEEEWLKFSKIERRHITLLQGSQKERLADFQALKGDAGHIFITNTEALIMKDLYAVMKEWKPEAIVYDECHDLKNPSAQRSEAAFDLANPFDKKAKLFAPKPKTYMLSGSPVLSSPLDIFQQVKIQMGGWPLLAGGKLSGQIITNYFVFRGRFFRDRNALMPKDRYFPDWQPMTLKLDGFDSIGEMARTLELISVYATKWNCPELNLPPELDITIECGMTAEQEKIYTAMKKDFIAYVSDTRACVASLAITKSLRLMQIVSGFVSTEGRGEEDDVADIRFKGTEKDEKLRQLIKTVSPSEKLLVWAVWRENYGAIRKICEELGVEYAEAHGEVSSDKKKLENVHRFKTRDRCRVFLGHPGSGGVGLNLTMGTQDAFYSRNYSTLHFVQARGRNHRAGQTQTVRHNNLTCRGTIDDAVLAQLSANLAMAENLLDPEKKNLSYKEVAKAIGPA
jgi:SNF2 family DNA or RNA helicase